MPEGGSDSASALADLEAAKAVLHRAQEGQDEPTGRLVRAILRIQDLMAGDRELGW